LISKKKIELEKIRAKYEEKKNELEGKIMKLKNIGYFTIIKVRSKK
jgi:hypothetical protein